MNYNCMGINAMLFTSFLPQSYASSPLFHNSVNHLRLESVLFCVMSGVQVVVCILNSVLPCFFVLPLISCGIRMFCK